MQLVPKKKSRIYLQRLIIKKNIYIDFGDINILENIWKSGSFYIFTFTQLIYSNSKYKCGITVNFP